ncbi:MAG TPA: aldose 1-epimerase [Solirubrobacteraceae bacterium]|jgi:aldose 1-epimerase|nr:aldose 1-epimerase [Solirubrobacteraceae bacterium]
MRGAPEDGYETVVIESPDAELQATFVPGAGMVCCSLRHRGEELLAQRAGVRAYAQRGSTMGIPLLYPWANRLAALRYPGPSGEVELAADDPLLKLDANGLPIHGAIPGLLPWELCEAGPEQLRARLRWEQDDLLALFPYRHAVELSARIDRAGLTIATTVSADGDCDVPVSFGFHPYLSPPGGDRASWHVELPVSERLVLDGRMIPTGKREPLQTRRFELAGGGWDDAYAGLLEPPIFVLTGSTRTLRLGLLDGYSYAQLYAPAEADFACFEPMTAPTNALVSRSALPSVRAGQSFAASFQLSVELS